VKVALYPWPTCYRMANVTRPIWQSVEVCVKAISTAFSIAAAAKAEPQRYLFNAGRQSFPTVPPSDARDRYADATISDALHGRSNSLWLVTTLGLW
jgi:hypothetical protein